MGTVGRDVGRSAVGTMGMSLPSVPTSEGRGNTLRGPRLRRRLASWVGWVAESNRGSRDEARAKAWVGWVGPKGHLPTVSPPPKPSYSKLLLSLWVGWVERVILFPIGGERKSWRTERRRDTYRERVDSRYPLPHLLISLPTREGARRCGLGSFREALPTCA